MATINSIIVDTNIVFSAILNINSKIAQILFNSIDHYNFYAPEYIRTEIIEHQDKIKRITGLSDGDFIQVHELIFSRITVINHSLIPVEFYRKAFERCKSIDPDDTIFVALAEYFDCQLWTGDKKLIQGLHKTGFLKATDTEELYQHFLKLKSNK